MEHLLGRDEFERIRIDLRPVTNCATADELLIQYLSADDEACAQEALARLLQAEVQPRIRGIVAGRLSPWNSESQDVDDVCGDAVVVLLGRLKAMRASGEGEIAHIGSYAAAVAHQMVANYLRRKYPLRHQLQNRVRYALNHTAGLATWSGPAGEVLCGREQWIGTGSPAPSQELVDRWVGVSAPLAIVIHRILDYLGGPVAMETLVTMAARALRVVDRTVELKPELHATDGAAGNAARSVDHRRWLTRLWAEIGELPVAQRVALLLHLRFDGNRPAVALFITTGIAGLRAIAAMLSVPAEEFAALWGTLPLDDLAIAKRLGVTRQQVINLRQAALKRLERRLTSWGAEV